MRLKLCSAVAVIWALCHVAPASADDASPITKIESRQLPPNIVTQRVLSQLSKILHLEQYPVTGEKPRLPLSDLGFWTSPRATSSPDLCAVDELTVAFRPSSASLQGADTRTVAESIQAQTFYRFLHTPASSSMPAMHWPDILATRERCAAVRPGKDVLFTAPSPESAVEGMWLTAEFAKQLATGAPVFKLDCSNYSDGSKCLAAAKEMNPASVTGISNCYNANGLLRCWEISQFDVGVRLTAAYKNGRPSIVEAQPIEWVTVADYRQD